MKESLFVIDSQLESIIDEIIENGGEITPELEEQLTITQDNLNKKLDNYRKLFTIIESRALACKTEKQRIEVLQKSRERAAKKLKDAMLEAVLKWGNSNKSGNKVIELDDAKLMTRATTVCETNAPLVLSLIDAVLERYRELWNVDMLQPDADEANNIDPEGFVQTVNANFAAENPDAAETIEERNNTLFTVADLEATKVKFEIELNLLDLCKKVNWDVLNMFFNHEHEANRVAASSTSDYKQYITSRETALTVAELCQSQSLTIK